MWPFREKRYLCTPCAIRMMRYRDLTPEIAKREKITCECCGRRRYGIPYRVGAVKFSVIVEDCAKTVKESIYARA